MGKDIKKLSILIRSEVYTIFNVDKNFISWIMIEYFCVAPMSSLCIARIQDLLT